MAADTGGKKGKSKKKGGKKGKVPPVTPEMEEVGPETFYANLLGESTGDLDTS